MSLERYVVVSLHYVFMFYQLILMKYLVLFPCSLFQYQFPKTASAINTRARKCWQRHGNSLLVLAKHQIDMNPGTVCHTDVITCACHVHSVSLTYIQKGSDRKFFTGGLLLLFLYTLFSQASFHFYYYCFSKIKATRAIIA